MENKTIKKIEELNTLLINNFVFIETAVHENLTNFAIFKLSRDDSFSFDILYDKEVCVFGYEHAFYVDFNKDGTVKQSRVRVNKKGNYKHVSSGDILQTIKPFEFKHPYEDRQFYDFNPVALIETIKDRIDGL